MNQQACEFARDWKHHGYGFWSLEGEATGRQFSLNNHTDASWTPPDLSQLVAFLNSCPIAVAAQQSPAKCGFCDELLHVSAYRSDGALVWPDALAHLIEKHAFILPDAWVEHIRQTNYAAPPELAVTVDRMPWPTAR